MTICVDEHRLEAVEALAQMRHLRHLVFETQPEAELGWMTSACLYHMPLLRRCGRPVDPSRFYYLYSREMAAYLKVHLTALKQHHGPPLQLEEAFFYHQTTEYYPDYVPIFNLRMPNLSKLALYFSGWHPCVLTVLQNVTELSLYVESRREAKQVLDAVGHQLRKVIFMKV